MKPLNLFLIALCAATMLQTGYADSRIHTRQADGASAHSALRSFIPLVEEALALWQGETRAHVLRQLGEPRAVQQRRVVNRHDTTVIDVVEIWHYAKMRVWFYLATAKQAEYLIRIDPDQTLLSASLAVLRSRLGEPLWQDGETVAFGLKKFRADAPELVVELVSGRIASLTLVKYVD